MNKVEKTATIPAINIASMGVTIIGKTPLIFHQFSEKSKKMMRDKQAKVANKGRETRDPDKEYHDSFYYLNDGRIGMPALNIKQAMVGAARNIEGVTMALLRGAIFVKAEETETGLIHVDYDGKDKGMREDVVRVGMGSADLRYRGELNKWSMTFDIEYNADVLSGDQVVNLLQLAGFACGLGEWRPERNGDKGTFELLAKELPAKTPQEVMPQ